MRITPLRFNKALSSYKKNNHTDYSQYRYPVLGDSFTFTGTNPAPLGRNAVSGLASLGVTCLCCGKKMIDVAEISRLDTSGVFKGQSKDILKALNKFKTYMKPLEKKVYNLLCSLEKEYPEKNLAQLLGTQKNNLEAKLINKQSVIFGNIYEYATKHLSAQKMDEIGEIIQNSYNEIYSNNPTTIFGRKRFIGLIYKYTRDIDPKHQKKLLELAETLPSSKDQFEAFIIKYSRKNNRDIAMRLLERSVGTIEHIKTRADGGADSIYNYALECAEDNWARGCSSMIEQIKKNPSMPQNAQKQINQIIKLINQKRTALPARYIEEIKSGLYRASGGVIDLNISGLKPDLM